MSHYRDLNKELVEQVQTMRHNIKLYCDEIVYLKGELMQKHETEIILRKQCYNWAVNSFVQLIQNVQPDSEILPVLEEHVNSGERITSTLNGRRHPWTGRISDARRRSSILTRELQRSNSVINLRKSVCSTSPVRRSSNDTSDEEEHNTQNMPGNAEEDNNAQDADSDAAQIPRAVNIENIIFEESEEKEEEIYNCEDSVYESVEEVSINISEKRGALNNITNFLKSSNILTRKQDTQDIVNKRAAPVRTKKKNFAGKENSSDEYTTSKEDSDIDIVKKPNKLKQKNLAEKSNKIIDDDTPEEPRRYSNSRRNFDDASKSFPLNQNDGQILNEEITLASTTLVLTDVTLRNFKDAACSTPNSRKNSLETTRATQCESVSTVQTSANTSSRPSRHCKPTNFAERPLKSKLRNESEATLERKTSRKPKSKPKTRK